MMRQLRHRPGLAKGMVILAVTSLSLASGAWSAAIQSRPCGQIAEGIVGAAVLQRPTAALDYTPANQCGEPGELVEAWYAGERTAVVQYARWENGDEFASMANAHAVLCVDGRARVWISGVFNEVCSTLSAAASSVAWSRDERLR